MRFAKQQVTELTRSNITSLFPEYSATTSYVTELWEVPTYKSIARIGNYLYRSTSEENIGNYPLDNMGVHWILWDVSNIYAMLDFKGTTQTEWEGDGVVEFRKGLATVLAVGMMVAGCVEVDVLEEKHGVVSGLSLFPYSDKYSLAKGEWYVDSIYYEQNASWTFNNTILEASSDNYIYPVYTNTSGSLKLIRQIDIKDDVAFAISYDYVTALDISDSSNTIELGNYKSASFESGQGIAISGDIAYVVSDYKDSITAIDISNPYNMIEIGTFTSVNLNGAKGIAISGDVAYITAYTGNAITAIDISNPYNMIELDSLTSVNIDGAIGIAISGTVAYITAYTSDSITAIDITTPTALSELDSFTSVNIDAPIDVAISGTVAYITSSLTDSVVSIDISIPSVLAELDSFASVNIDNPRGIEISGTVAYIASSGADSVVSIDITTPAALSELDSLTNSSLLDTSNIAISGDVVISSSGNIGSITSIDIITPSALSEISHFPETSVNIISVPTGFDAPQTPTGELEVWMITTDASNLFVSMTDLRVTITDDAIAGLTQTKTFYNDGYGATLFDLPVLGEIVRVTFKGANGIGASCGTLIAGTTEDMGTTLTDVNFTRKRVDRDWKRVADFTTIVDKENLTVIANKGEEAQYEEALFIIDTSTDSVFQNMLVSGFIDDVSHSANNFTKQNIKWRVEGEKMVNETPVGLTDIPYSEIATIDALSVTKGSGEVIGTRSTTGTYISKYDKVATSEIDEPRFTNVNDEQIHLSECGSTNIKPQSQCYIGWSASRLVLTQNSGVAPDETITSTLATHSEDGTSVYLYRKDSEITSGLPYTASYRVKPDSILTGFRIQLHSETFGADADAHFRFDTDEIYNIGVDIVNTSLEKLDGGWYEVSVSAVATTSDATGILYDSLLWNIDFPATVNATPDSFEAWGGQLEQKAFPTSYTPTLATAVTRAGDITSYDSSNIPDLTSDWSMKWRGIPTFESEAVEQQVIINKVDSDNLMHLYIFNGEIIFSLKNSGVAKYSVGGTIVSDTEMEIIITCESGIVKTYIGGVLKDTDDFSTVLDTPIADLTYLGSASANPNSNSIIKTIEHKWYDYAIEVV